MEREHGFKAAKRYQHAIRGFLAKMNEAQARRLMEDPAVEYVAEDVVVSANYSETNPVSWGLDRVDQRSRPLSGAYSYAQTAPDVNVYVVDSGIRATHLGFGGLLVSGYDAVGDGWGISDCTGHGSHVAGTITGTFSGVARVARLHVVRVLKCDNTSEGSMLLDGIDWIVSAAPARAVMNLSLEVAGGWAPLDSAVQGAINAGITVVAAAGNGNTDACTVSPARVSGAITVGATNSTDVRSSFSNFGTCVDLFAPGEDIWSASAYDDLGLAMMSGTSMAAPHVAGAAALYLQAHPTATPSDVATALVNGATSGMITGAGTGSPNRLLFAPRTELAFRTDNSSYLTAYNGGGSDMRANASASSTWERFGLFDLNGGALESGDQIQLVSYNGHFVVAENGGGGVVNVNRVAAQNWETFRIWKQNGSGSIGSGDTIALQAQMEIMWSRKMAAVFL